MSDNSGLIHLTNAPSLICLEDEEGYSTKQKRKAKEDPNFEEKIIGLYKNIYKINRKKFSYRKKKKSKLVLLAEFDNTAPSDLTKFKWLFRIIS